VYAEGDLHEPRCARDIARKDHLADAGAGHCRALESDRVHAFDEKPHLLTRAHEKRDISPSFLTEYKIMADHHAFGPDAADDDVFTNLTGSVSANSRVKGTMTRKSMPRHRMASIFSSRVKITAG
jgi:hypothetical protein